MENRWIWLLILLQICMLEPGAAATDFSGANLSGAHLTNADLHGSNLAGANLADANLSRTNLTGSNVTQQQLDSACGYETELPVGLKIKPCPISTTSEADADEIRQLGARDDPGSSPGISIEFPPLDDANTGSSTALRTGQSLIEVDK